MLRERKSWQNQLKRMDVYSCGFSSHRHFQYAVSVYHVLIEKKCFPEGCVYFKWKCRRLDKGDTCRKKFRHVGRKCFSCKEFIDEKQCFTPSAILSSDEYKLFLKELKEFEEWFGEIDGKEIDFSGTVHAIKPHLTRTVDKRRNYLDFQGFLLVFKEGYFHYDHLDDYCYLRISRRQQQRWKFRIGDKVDFNAIVNMDHGRIILKRPRQVEIFEKGEADSPSFDRLIVEIKTGSSFSHQPEKCLVCKRGCLIDVEDSSKRDIRFYRQIYCLEGFVDPFVCSYHALKKLKADYCHREQADIAGWQVG